MRGLVTASSALLVTLGGAACDGPSDDATDLGAVARPIINGTTTPSITPLSAGETLAIGFLATPAGDPFCSGTVIRSNAVLTAQHCVKDKGAADLRFGIGTPGAPRALVRVTRIALADWESDIALLQLANDATTVGGLRPIAENRAALDQDLVGEDVEIAGYAPIDGVSSLRFAVLQVTSVFDALTLDGFGQHGACQGDSGGPVLLTDGTGRAVVAGTAIGGNISCRDEVYYSRVDRVVEWLDVTLRTFASDGETSGDAPGSGPGFDPWGCGQTSCGAGVGESGITLAGVLVLLGLRARRARRARQG
ncbi:MAG: trypsin-like serine protease [Myxococcota bacterium]